MPQRERWFDLHDDSADPPDVAILGLPYDAGASLKRGASLAPARLRELSRTSDPITRRGDLIEGLTLRDFGDVMPAEGAPQRGYLEAARDRIEALPAEAFVLALGGDNSVSIAALEAFARRHGPGSGVIWFDAHPDLFESYAGNPDSHACALRRGAGLGGLDLGRAVLLATRSWSAHEARFARQEGIEAISASDWLGTSASEVADRIASRLAGCPAVYFAVDVDGFDSAAAPGTGYPMPGGVTAEMFFRLQEILFERLPVRAMDLTEIAPPLDTNDVTSFLGVQVILETLGLLARRGAKRERRPRA